MPEAAQVELHEASGAHRQQRSRRLATKIEAEVGQVRAASKHALGVLVEPKRINRAAVVLDLHSPKHLQAPEGARDLLAPVRFVPFVLVLLAFALAFFTI
eukprot:scaffold1738_cov73-Phaeocystis_antarctica.AAC.8